MKPPGPSRRAGHTLVELMIAVTLLALFMGMVARAQQPFTRMVIELQDRARASSELHLAVDWLTRDFGGAATVAALGRDGLLISRENALLADAGIVGADPGIAYRLDEGRLVRSDRHRDEDFVVADGLVDFIVARRGAELRAVLVDGIEPEQHRVTLVWRDR